MDFIDKMSVLIKK